MEELDQGIRPVEAAPGAPPGHRPAHRIVRNSLLHFVSQVFLAVCFAGVLFILARTLGTEGLGRYYTIFALITAVQFIMEGGISTVLTSRIAQNPLNWRQRFAEAAGLMTLVMAASAALLIAIGIAWTVIRGEAGYLAYFALAACSCAALQFRRFCAATFNAFEMFREDSVARILQGGGYFGLVAALALAGRVTLLSALGVLALSQLVAAAYLLVKLQQRWRCLSVRLSRSIARDWLARALPLGAGDVFRELTLQLGTLLLGVLKPAAVVGIYSMAFRPLVPLTILPQAVLLAVFPSFSRLAHADARNLGLAFAHSIRLLWVMSIPIVMAIFVCAEPLVLLFGGRQYLPAVLPMRLLIWIIMLYYLSIQFRFLFAALDRQRIYVRLAATTLAIELVVAFWLIPYWGYLGACAAALVGELFLTTAGFWMCYRLGIRGIDWKAMIRAAAAGLLCGGLLWPARTAGWPVLLTGMALAAGLYFALCVALHVLRRAEIEELYHALARIIRSPRETQRPQEPALDQQTAAKERVA